MNQIVQSPPRTGINEGRHLADNKKENLTGFGSKAVHSGTNHVGDAVNTQIFQSSTYKLTDEHYAGWAAGAHHTLLYTRITSVNAEAVIDKICALEGAEDGEVFSSGMAAISTTLLSVLSSGDHVVASADVYGGTYGLMTEEFPRLGIEVTMADMTDPTSYEAAIKDNTKVLYIETLTNPVLKVCDIEAMTTISKKHGLICIIDNTFTSPWGCQPLSFGADLVIHSTTKYLGGHSDIIGGAVVGSREHIENIFHRKVHFGGSADPHTCFLLERGMRTLHVRMPKICENAAELAKRLEAHDMIERVNHPSLKSHEQYEIAQRIMPKGTGMIGFVVKGGDQAALSFMRGLTMIYEATSLGGVESLVECPFNSSHMMIPEDVRHAAGLVPGYVRMSIGIEDIEDLWSDIERGFANVK